MNEPNNKELANYVDRRHGIEHRLRLVLKHVAENTSDQWARAYINRRLEELRGE